MAASAMQSAQQWTDDVSDHEPTRSDATEPVTDRAADAAASFTREMASRHPGYDADQTYNIIRTVRLVGGGMIVTLLTAVVLNEVFGAVSVGSGPFSQIGTDLQTTGVAAMGLLIVGFIVIAANRLMGIFGGSGGM